MSKLFGSQEFEKVFLQLIWIPLGEADLVSFDLSID
jgi:hypothetical protein